MSMKAIPHLTSYYIWITSIFDSANNNLSALFDPIISVFSQFPESILDKIKNMNLYIEYLETLKILMNFLHFMFKRVPRANSQVQDYFYENFDKIFRSQIYMLKNMPQIGTHTIRKEILGFIKQEIIDISMQEKNDTDLNQRQGIVTSRMQKGVFEKRNQVFRQLLDDILITPNLSGKGKLSKEISIISKQIQLQVIWQIKSILMTASELRLSFALITKSLLDSSLTLNFRSQFVVTMYRLFDDFKRHNIDGMPEVCEILEILTLFVKNLDLMFAILAKEFATIKTEVANLKKTPRVKFMNEIEQKNADIREILLSDGGAPFVDLSRDKTYPPEVFDLTKTELEYRFFFIHDHTVEQTQSDVTKLKENKYTWLMNFTEQQVNDYVENMKDSSCIRLFKSALSFIDSMMVQIIEKQKGSNFFHHREMKNLKRFFIHGVNIIQHLSDMQVGSNLPPAQQAERSRLMDENLRRFI